MEKIHIFWGIGHLSSLQYVYENIGNMFLSLIELEDWYKEMHIETTRISGCNHLKMFRVDVYILVDDGVVDDAFLKGDEMFIRSFLRNIKSQRLLNPIEFIMQVDEE